MHTAHNLLTSSRHPAWRLQTVAVSTSDSMHVSVRMYEMRLHVHFCGIAPIWAEASGACTYMQVYSCK